MTVGKLRVEGIILDLDGTIVDSREAYLHAVKSAFKSMGRENIDEKLALEIPKRLEQKLPINDMLGGVDTEKFLKIYLNTYYGVTSEKSKPIPNVSLTLKKLSQKAKLALITMRFVPREAVIAELEKFGLAKYFQHVMTALDTDKPKPSPDALKKCMEMMCIQPEECLVVGDSIADIRAGKSVGAKTVAVLSGIFSREELEKENPDFIIGNINELPDILERL